MYLLTLLGLDTREQVLRTSGFYVISWTDELLRWNPDDYGGILEITVQQKEIWFPDLYAANSIRGYQKFGTDDLRLYVNHSGTVDWEPTFSLSTSCFVDVSLFPVDSQICSIIILPWMTTNQEITIKNPKFDNSLFEAPNGDFAITHTNVTQAFYPVYELTLSKFTLAMKRKSSLYLLNVVGPFVGISSLCIISFLIDSQSGERLSVSITVLLTLTVFLSVIDDLLPKTANSISYFVIYVALMIGMNFLCVLCNVATLCIHNRSKETPIPTWLSVILIKENLLESNDTHSVNSSTDLEPSSYVCCHNLESRTSCNHWPEIAKIVDRAFFILIALALVSINFGFLIIHII
ncbi:neuronal acetylcholine receptor subunit beta-3 [Patella vulgata]|uniref:neuronal acetylcholine receptor subunit beta-3 n=1 Tax=Patella vulgata TaxID=6465 RepID=UPI0024A8F89C|nr:neuronal acetylcholine receptor subunit beta-3 [Patella vulgata]